MQHYIIVTSLLVSYDTTLVLRLCRAESFLFQVKRAHDKCEAESQAHNTVKTCILTEVQVYNDNSGFNKDKCLKLVDEITESASLTTQIKSSMKRSCERCFNSATDFKPDQRKTCLYDLLTKRCVMKASQMRSR
ncbi:hypothetical protein CHUAL_006230 [Chamberlinius hualienensis]